MTTGDREVAAIDGIHRGRADNDSWSVARRRVYSTLTHAAFSRRECRGGCGGHECIVGEAEGGAYQDRGRHEGQGPRGRPGVDRGRGRLREAERSQEGD